MYYSKDKNINWNKIEVKSFVEKSVLGFSKLKNELFFTSCLSVRMTVAYVCMQRWRGNDSIDFHQIWFEHTNWAKIDAREGFFIVKINPFSAKQVVWIRLVRPHAEHWQEGNEKVSLGWDLGWACVMYNRYIEHVYYHSFTTKWGRNFVPVYFELC